MSRAISSTTSEYHAKGAVKKSLLALAALTLAIFTPVWAAPTLTADQQAYCNGTAKFAYTIAKVRADGKSKESVLKFVRNNSADTDDVKSLKEGIVEEVYKQDVPLDKVQQRWFIGCVNARIK